MSKLVENYLLQQPIGKGVYGQVYRAVHQKTKQVFAVKVIPKSSFRSNPKLQQLAINQINILSSLKHENIVRFIQTLKTPNNFYFVYQYCNDGTIQNLIHKNRFLKESQALIIFRQLLQAFKQLNKNNIMHRDLKPDNIFLSNGQVKLGDFGFCKMLQVNMAQTMLGSPIYMAPQILKEQIYTSKADIWSLGVVLFELLFGFCPYQSSSISQLINVIKQNDLVIPKDINPISEKTQTLLRKILVKDQFKRIEWVDLFQFKIDQKGNIVQGYNKQMGIQALEKYFLNDVKSAGQIIINDNPPQKLKKQQSKVQVADCPSSPMLMEFKSQKISNNNQSGFSKNNIQNEPMPTSMKKVSSNINNDNSSALLKSESLGKAGPGPYATTNVQPEIKQFTHKAQTQNNFYTTPDLDLRKKNSSQAPQMHRVSSGDPYKKPISNSNQLSFIQKHQLWTQTIELIHQLSQKGSLQNDKCIYWIAKSLLSRMSAEYGKYPQWTDVIMQEKEQINELIKQLEHIEINKDYDKKNQILKIWSKSAVKGDQTWDKAVRFIFGEENNYHRSVEDILLN